MIKGLKMKNISVVGIGKLGLCFSLTLEKAGYNVLGVDLSLPYVNSINNKTLKSSEPNVETYLESSKNFRATTSLQEIIDHSDTLFVIVATPSLENGRYDHTQIDNLIDKLEAFGPQANQKHFIVCCTTMPGYCDSIKERLNSINYTVSYNPEFIAQGTILRDQAYPDMVLIGEANPVVGQLIEDIYVKHTSNNPRICRMTPLEAEITKLSLNCFLTTKIAYTNMIGDIVHKSGGRPDIVLSAIGADSRIGNKYLRYGYGYGGPCFPRDNRALAMYANDIDMPAEISKATDKSNELHLLYQVEMFKAQHHVHEKFVFDTVTYKPESTLLVESQQLKFVVALAREGYNITIKERPSVIAELKTIYGDLFTYEEKN
jgi:nucleotide sugar dehydrogenase